MLTQTVSVFWSELRRRISTAAGAALDLVLPRSCARCGTETSGPGFVCPDCFAQLHRIGLPCCDRCGVPLPSVAYAGKTSLCVRCERNPPVWDRARAVFIYDDASKALILPLKYSDRTELATGLGEMMFRAGEALFADTDLIVPVPVHWRRRISRRYNQAALLARVVSRLSGVPVLTDALRRPHATQKLALVAPGERRRIMQDAIITSPGRVNRLNGKRVLLVDDVLTTGATGTACTLALKTGGAVSVMILAAARTEAPEREDADLPEYADQKSHPGILTSPL